MSTCPAPHTADTALLEHYVKKILAAPVYDLAVRTPLQAAPALSALLGNQVLLKREDLQPTFSFKIRGAYNKLVQLTAEQKARGVVTASAGNHAQGVALAAKELGIQARIVMPCSTPELKVLGVRSRGAEAVLHGESFPFALAHALQLAETSGCTFVSPFDDPDVIAGQGTVAMEILRQQQGPLDAIFVPVGGGGLIAGIAAYVKYLRPEVRIIGRTKDTLQGRCIGILFDEGSDAGLIASLRKAAQKAGAEVKLVAPKVGGATLSDGKRQAADGQLAGTPSAVFDAVAVVLSAEGAKALAREAAAVEFVSHAWAHLKAIASDAGGQALLKAARVGNDAGIVEAEDAKAFLAAAATRQWTREPKLRLLA